MKITLYMGITVDGFIAKTNDDTSWVSDIDWANFSKFIHKQDVIIMGRKTFEVSGANFPFKGALNIVATSNKKLLFRKETKQELFINKKPQELIKFLKEKGYQNIGIIGGGKFNSSMLKEKLIDEVFIDIHPLILGSGIKLFENFEGKINLKLLDTQNLSGGLLVLHYKVLY